MFVYQDNSTIKIMKKLLEFPEVLHTDSFPLQCSYTNFLKKLFISGGIVDGKECKMFFNYDYSLDKTIRLSDMNVPRKCHTTLMHNDHIYAVGGTNNKTIERYSLENLRWIRLGLMNQERQNTISMVRDEYLYIFFDLLFNVIFFDLFLKSIVFFRWQ